MSGDSAEKFVSPLVNIVHRNQSSSEDVASDRGVNYHNQRNIGQVVVPAKSSMIPKSRTERISNIKQLERRIVTKYISDELRLLNNNGTTRMDPADDDGYEVVSSPSSVKDLEAEFERNKVKIYVGGAFKGDKQSSFVTENLEDSDKDYGYYDQVTADSGSCSEDGYGSRRVSSIIDEQQSQTTTTAKDISDDSLVNIMEMSGGELRGKLGCDGAIFWNEHCYEDECKVQCSVTEPYVCVCGSSSKVTLGI